MKTSHKTLTLLNDYARDCFDLPARVILTDQADSLYCLQIFKKDGERVIESVFIGSKYVDGMLKIARTARKYQDRVLAYKIDHEHNNLETAERMRARGYDEEFIKKAIWGNRDETQ